MGIKRIYTFTLPRTEAGNLDWATIARQLLDAGADQAPSLFIGLMDELVKYHALGKLSGPDEVPDGLVAGLLLRGIGPEVVGNREACAKLADAYMERQWNGADSHELTGTGVRIQNNVAELWATVETVSVPDDQQAAAQA